MSKVKKSVERGFMNKPVIVLLCAPANVGKSRAMEYLKKRGLNLTYASCKEPLHKATIALFGVPEERYWEIYNDRKLKEKPLPEFSINLPIADFLKLEECVEGLGLSGFTTLSIRNAMIYTSEVIMKSRFGLDIFGRIRANSLQDGGTYIDDSTAAFDVDGVIKADEITPLIHKVGQDNILLIRIHREGFDFTGDSRRYVLNGVCKNTVDIVNTTEDEFYEEVYRTVDNFLSSRGYDG